MAVVAPRSWPGVVRLGDSVQVVPALEPLKEGQVYVPSKDKAVVASNRLAGTPDPGAIAVAEIFAGLAT